MQGSLILLFQFDVAESTPPCEPGAPEQFVLPSGERVWRQVRCFEYGVVGFRYELRWNEDWEGLAALTKRWLDGGELAGQAARDLEQWKKCSGAGMQGEYAETTSEEYCVVRLDPEAGMGAAELLERWPGQVSRIVRGEVTELSREEQAEVLAAAASYYPADLMVVGWAAALVYDTKEGAQPTLDLLETANAQLLELRYYDAVLSRVLKTARQELDGTRGGLFRRWRLAHEAEKLNELLIDVRETTERLDHSVKYLSDMFAARVYRLAAARIGVGDYRRLVEAKLAAATDVYRFMVDQFHHGRGFVLELLVVIILVIELGFLFGGKR